MINNLHTQKEFPSSKYMLASIKGKVSPDKPGILIGTSGWSYESWAGIFYPENLNKTDWLNHYSKNFNTVEINSSFYHLPKKETFKNWADKTPENFLFSVKASKYITHTKRLKDCCEAIERLFNSAGGLGNKLAIFLFQLPQNLKKDVGRLGEFIKKLPSNYRYAFEFREASWFDDEVYALLYKYNCSIVISDSPKFPKYEIIISDFCYFRMHGSTSLYASKYSDSELESIARKIWGNFEKGITTLVYFNNDMHGYAVENARTLKNLISI